MKRLDVSGRIDGEVSSRARGWDSDSGNACYSSPSPRFESRFLTLRVNVPRFCFSRDARCRRKRSRVSLTRTNHDGRSSALYLFICCTILYLLILYARIFMHFRGIRWCKKWHTYIKRYRTKDSIVIFSRWNANVSFAFNRDSDHKNINLKIYQSYLTGPFHAAREIFKTGNLSRCLINNIIFIDTRWTK